MVTQKKFPHGIGKVKFQLKKTFKHIVIFFRSLRDFVYYEEVREHKEQIKEK